MSKALLGKWAEIEVASLDLEDQIVAEWVPLLGITYEVRGPFHGTTAVPLAADDGLVSGLLHNTVEPPVRSLNAQLGDAVHIVDRAVMGLGL